MNIVDMTLQRSFPSVMVPSREALAPMSAHGERLLIAKNGVFLEVSRPWLRMVRLIAPFVVATAVPYGRVEPVTTLTCGAIPPALVGAFARQARAAFPNETGAWIVWRPLTETFRLVPVTILQHSPEALRYDTPELAEDEVLAVDCHSHGATPAFFSPTDDADDQHDVKFALVVGNCRCAVPSFALRLCAKGLFEPFARIPDAWYRAAAGEVQ